MDAEPVPQFGEALPGLTYRERPGAYALVVRDGLLLVVETPAGCFLPGGGVDAGEAAEDALRRELREETGLSVASMTAIGTARQYVVEAETGIGYNKIERFYRVTICASAPDPLEVDHTACWITIEDALAGLREPAQAWAVRVALLSR